MNEDQYKQALKDYFAWKRKINSMRLQSDEFKEALVKIQELKNKIDEHHETISKFIIK